MRALKADATGLGYWMEREAKAMSEQQIYRELVQNGIEAGATRIDIDGWADPDTGHTLARVTDDGAGMTDYQLVKYLSTLHVQSKGGTNFGVGARIASLPKNPAGVTFASRTETGEGMVRLVKSRAGVYGVKEWRVEVDGYEQLVEVVVADQGELDRAKRKTGTAVIMHGTGGTDTWTSSASYQVRKFLGQRYYQFPGDVKVRAYDPDDGKAKLVKPFGDYLAEKAAADGEVPFKNVAGLNGVMFWWTLPKVKDTGVAVPYGGGIGTVVEDEIFDYSTGYSPDFGIIYGSVAKRVAVLIWIDEASMDTGRAGVVLPDGRKNVPWKKLGQHFAAHMPDEIDELLSSVTVASASFDSELAELLDEDWMKKLDPVEVPSSDEDGESGVGDDAGDALPPGDDYPGDDDSSPNPDPNPRQAAERSTAGPKPAKRKAKVVTPRVEFLPQQDVAEGKLITYLGTANVLQIAYEIPALRKGSQEVGRGDGPSGECGDARGAARLSG